MKRTPLSMWSAVLPLLAASISACSEGAGASADLVPATVSLSQAGVAALGAALLDGDSGRGDTIRFGGARIRRSAIDSLVVTMTRVDVLPDSEIHRCHPPVGDSINGFRPGPGGPEGRGPGEGPMGPPPGGCRPHDGRPPHPPRDSLVPPDSGWGSRQRNWYSLDVVGSGHLNLLALPTDTADGLVLASGTLPVGSYGAARLIVSSAKIWFDTTITTATGATFLPNTAYDVTLPGRDSTDKGIMTKAGFTLTAAGADVVLVFDANSAIGGAVVTGDGKIIIRPTLVPHRGPHR